MFTNVSSAAQKTTCKLANHSSSSASKTNEMVCCFMLNIVSFAEAFVVCAFKFTQLKATRAETTTIEEKKLYCSCNYAVHQTHDALRNWLSSTPRMYRHTHTHTPCVSFDFVRFGLHDFISLAHFRQIILFCIQIRCWYFASFHFTSIYFAVCA